MVYLQKKGKRSDIVFHVMILGQYHIPALFNYRLVTSTNASRPTYMRPRLERALPNAELTDSVGFLQ